MSVRAAQQSAEVATAEPPRRTRRGLRRVAVVGAVGFLLVAIVVGIARSQHHRSAAPPAPTPPPASIPGAPAGLKLVGYHGITVAVPISFPFEPDDCYEPKVNAVVAADGLVFYCPIATPPSPELTIVGLGSYHGVSGLTNVRHVSVGTAPAIRADEADESRHTGVVGLPSLNVEVPVASPDAGVVERILASVRISPIDGHGCRDRPTPLTANSNHTTDTVLPVPGIGRVVSCVYTADRRLIWSGSLSAAQLAVLRAQFAHAGLGSTGSPRFDFVVRYLVRYADGSTRVVEATTEYVESVVHATDGRLHVTFHTARNQRLPYSYG